MSDKATKKDATNPLISKINAQIPIFNDLVLEEL